MAQGGRRGRRKKQDSTDVRSGPASNPPGGGTGNSEGPPQAILGNVSTNQPEQKVTAMPDATPAWIAAMRDLDGTSWAPGDGPNPTILEWLRVISSSYTNMASYCASAMKENYFSWCGLTVGYCMTKAGIAPVFGANDTSRFLWAAAWLGWGTPVSNPQPGDVVVFDFGGGDHHVSLFEKDNGDGTWSCHGGNQSHKLTLTNFHKSSVIGIRHPVATIAVAPKEPAAAPVKPASQRFADCVALVLHDEGGNDDDPRDPGGRTSRGILQREWDVWRQTHLGLPADVWDAPQDQVLAIYHDKYWNPLSCDSLPAGVDYAVFDYGVLSGIGRAAKVLQGFVGTDVDGEIGPKTIAATVQADAPTLIKQICDERLAFLQRLETWPTFGKGWTRRVQGVRNAALAMVSAGAVAVTPPPPTPAPKPTTPQVPSLDDIRTAVEDAIRRFQEKGMADTTSTPQNGSTAAPKLDINQWLTVLKQLGIPQAPQGADGSTAPILSPIDKVLGGQAMAGLKTPLAIVAYVVVLLTQAGGALTDPHTIQVLTAVITAFGGLGVTAKIDRAIQALAAVAAAAQKVQSATSSIVPPQST
jgi:uncharacterized protein (TIGR02594 family)